MSIYGARRAKLDFCIGPGVKEETAAVGIPLPVHK